MRSELYYDPELDSLLLISYVDDIVICDAGAQIVHAYMSHEKLNFNAFELIDNNF